jgi:hypothetical protein
MNQKVMSRYYYLKYNNFKTKYKSKNNCYDDFIINNLDNLKKIKKMKDNNVIKIKINKVKEIKYNDKELFIVYF